MVALGYTEYEARVYGALVGTNPVTAYELAHLASVPTSKVYGVLAKLEGQGVVTVTEDGGKKRYLPLDPEEFVSRNRSRVTSTLDELQKGFRSVRQKSDLSYVWNISDPEWFRDKVHRMIDSAEKALFISLWGQELEICFEALQAAERRGVRISVVHFGKPEKSVGQLFAHPIEETLYSERGGRGFTLVTDSREALITTVYEDGRLEGACSMAPGFVILAEDYVKHDVYLMKIVRRFDPLLLKHFGAGYEKLRDVFSDREVKDEDMD